MTRLAEPLLEGKYLCINYVSDLAKIQEQLDRGPAAIKEEGTQTVDDWRSLLLLEQAFIFDALGERKLALQNLESARKAAVTEQQKLVYDHWARFQRRDIAQSSSELLWRQSRSFLEECQSDNCSNEKPAETSDESYRAQACSCVRAESTENSPERQKDGTGDAEKAFRPLGEGSGGRIQAAEDVVLLTVEGQFVACCRERMAELSTPFHAMLKGEYQESRKTAIPFDFNGLSPSGLQAVERFSRTGSLDESPGATCERWLCKARAESTVSLLSKPAALVPLSSSPMSDEEWSSSDELSDAETSDSEDEEESVPAKSPRRLPVRVSEPFTNASSSQKESLLKDVVPDPTSTSETKPQPSKDASRQGTSAIGRGLRRMASSRGLRSEFSGGFGKGMKIRVGSNGDLKALDEESQCSTQESHSELSTDAVVEILRFADRFCCEGLKAHCDERLAKTVNTSSEASSMLAFGLEESCPLLTARCLKLLFEKLPHSLIGDPDTADLLLGEEARRQLEQRGYASLLFYLFLAHTFRDNVLAPLGRAQPLRKGRAYDLATSCLTTALTFPSPPSLRGFAHYQLGCLHLVVKDWAEAKAAFEAALGAGYAPARAGMARLLAQQGDKLAARYKLSGLLSEGHMAAGWMFQERALCSDGARRKDDLETATRLCPTLTYPYKHRAARLLKEGKGDLAASEMDRALQFLVTPDLLEFRVYCCISLKDYESATRDLRALLTLEPRYMLYGGRVSAAQFLRQLSKKVPPLSKGECWLRLYERWSAVDDIGALAAVHKMLEDEPARAATLFRQSLLLHRVGCSTAAMRALRQARDHAPSEHERLVYEGWILYDTGRRAEALQKAQVSVSLAPTFEGYFLQAYALSDSTLTEHGPGAVIEILEKALKCPSDGLRKGQALNNLGSIYVDCGRYREAAECYTNALRIRHTRAHQGLARVHAMQGNRRLAYEEMTKLIASAQSNACAYEKRSEYCEPNQGRADLDAATRLNPLRTYPYRYRAAVLMDTLREEEAIEELSRAISFKVDANLLHLRAEFHACQGDLEAARQDARAALAIDPNHGPTHELWKSKLEASNRRRVD